MTWALAQKNGQTSTRRLRKLWLIARPSLWLIQMKWFEQAGVLLQSDSWSELAAGLAVATGRRAAEVMQTAQFKGHLSGRCGLRGRSNGAVNVFL